MKDLIRLYNIECPHPNEDNMYCYLCEWLQNHGVEYESDGKNIWRLTGQQMFLSSHYDMVQTRGRAEHFYDKNGIIKGYNKDYQQTSLGADDKNGIWICMKCIEDGIIPDFIWSFGEEVGLLGIHQLDDAGVLKDRIDESKVGLILDRAGCGEILKSGATGDYCNTLAQDLVNFGNKECGNRFTVGTGSVSDTAVLCKYCECVNISVGYYRQHTASEYTNFNELDFMRQFVKHVLVAFKHWSCPVSSYERKSYGRLSNNTREQGYQEDLFGEYRGQYYW